MFSCLQKFKKKHSFVSSILFTFTLLLLVYTLHEFIRSGGLPKHNSIGRMDDYALAYFLFGSLLLTFILGKLGKYIFGLLLLLVVILTISNWWYFSFYRDFISSDTLKLFFYAKESAMNFSGLPYKELALAFVFSISCLTALLFSIAKLKPESTPIFLMSILFLTMGCLKQFEFLQYEIGGGIHKGNNPISYLFRDIFSSKKTVNITESHINSLKALYPAKPIAELSENFPLESRILNKAMKGKKNVIIVVMESMRAAEMGVYTNNKEISVSPNLDEISQETMHFTNAYANSFQTVRGEFAILCSSFDYVRGSPFSESNKAIPTKCLPEILRENGYRTHWIHGYDEEFFNRGAFLPRLGFDNIHDQSVLNDASYNKVLGWGVPDTDLFKYAIDELEKETRPFFAEVLTLSNHFPYDWDWPLSFPKFIEDESISKYANYKRGMYYTDHAVGVFWDKFKQSPLYKNTIVIFTADHGIWLFDEKLSQKQDKTSVFVKKEKYFRIPLMIYNPEISQPSVVNQVVSQVDIAPTLLSLLGVSTKTAFWGRDIQVSESLNIKDSLAIFTGNGNNSFRSGNFYCHPSRFLSKKKGGCSSVKEYQKCNLKEDQETSYECTYSTVDLLSSEGLHLDFMDGLTDSAHVKRVMEYSQYGLEHGFISNPDQEALMPHAKEEY